MISITELNNLFKKAGKVQVVNVKPSIRHIQKHGHIISMISR